MTRLFVITGDASGDVHGSFVIRQLQNQAPEMEIQAIGGAQIEATGVPLFYHQRKMGALGGGIFAAIPSHLMLGFRLLNHFKSWRPEGVLLIDYGMFNLWMAKQLKKHGIPVFYYIPPQIWASRRGRLKTIRKYVDHVFCIFPFEKPLYDAAGIPATYVGHPLVEELPPKPDKAQFCRQHGLDPNLPLIGIFPGSRRSEIKGLLAPMVEALPLVEAKTGRRFQFVIAKSPAVPDTVFDAHYAPLKPITENLAITVLENQNYGVLALSEVALVSSGTVTLEAALYNVPAVIAYKLSRLAYTCFRRLAYVKHIGLPNLLCEEPDGFLPELLLDDVNPEAMSDALVPYLSKHSPELEKAKIQFEQIQATLGQHNTSEVLVHQLLMLLQTTARVPG